MQRVWGSFYKNVLYKFTVIIIIIIIIIKRLSLTTGNHSETKQLHVKTVFIFINHINLLKIKAAAQNHSHCQITW